MPPLNANFSFPYTEPTFPVRSKKRLLPTTLSFNKIVIQI